MNTWIILIILYAIFVSLIEVSKKKATKMNSIYIVLAFLTTLSLIFSALISRDIFRIDYTYIPAIMLKSFIVLFAWLLGLKALEGMQLSIYGMVKISRIIFTVLLSCLLLGEKLTLVTVIGMIIVIIGLILVNTTTNIGKDKKNSYKLIFLFLISCLCSSISAILDKKLLLHITTGQLQFWFLLFLSIYYWIILLIKKEKINIKEVGKNYWILLTAIFTVVGDRFLFMANADPSSKVIVMTMLKQLSVVISIILGKLIFKEKEVIKKLLYSILIIMGIVMILVIK